MLNIDKNRSILILKRYLDVYLIIPIIAIMITTLISSNTSIASETLLSLAMPMIIFFNHKAPWIPVCIIFTLITILPFIPIAKMGWLRIGRLKNITSSLCYPPSQNSVYVSLIIFLVLNFFPHLKEYIPLIDTSDLSHKPAIMCHAARLIEQTYVIYCGNLFSPDKYILSDFIICIFTFLAITIICGSISQSEKPTNEYKQQSNNNTFDFKNPVIKYIYTKYPDIALWITQEQPIDEIKYDLFKYTEYARKISQAIIDNRRTTFGITGSFGSGKSSLAKLVNLLIDKDHKDTFIHSYTSQWGAEDSLATFNIFNSAIRSISQYVDTLAILGIPQNYISSLESLSSKYGLEWIAQLVFPKNPYEEIQKLNNVLKCIGRRQIIYIEDIDRNNIEENVYNKFQATLDRLKIYDHITFVVLAHDAALDYSRLCDNKFVVPFIDDKNIISELKKTSQTALEYAYTYKNNEIIDSQIPTIYSYTQSLHSRSTAIKGDYTDPEWKPFCVLLSNPRRLKHVIRKSLSAWHNLHGEVDFHELLTAQTILATNSKAFNHIYNYYFKSTSNFQTEEIQKEEKAQADNNWHLITSEMPQYERIQLTILLNKFCGNKENKTIRTNYVSASLQSPNRNSIYWQRIWREDSSVDDYPKDQYLARNIIEWKNSNSKEIINNIFNNQKFSDAFYFFQENEGLISPKLELSNDELLKFTSQLIDKSISLNYSQSDIDDSLICCWRLCHRKIRQNRKPQYINWLTSEIKKTLLFSLRLTLDIEYYFASEKYSLVQRDDRVKIIETIINTIKLIWENNPNKFIDTLSCKSLKCAYAFSHIFSRKYDSESYNYNPQHFNWLTPLMMDALKLRPHDIAPHIFILISQTSHVREPISEDSDISQNVERWGVDFNFLSNLIESKKLRNKFINLLLDSTKDLKKISWPPDITNAISDIREALIAHLKTQRP